MNAETPRFSVVVPAFNAARTISATLESVRAQTLSDFEVVVVDDGSTDTTAKRVEAFADERVRLVRSGNRGPSAARNAGIENSRGELISFLDADDLWLPTYLERMRALLDAHPEAGFAFTDAYVWHDDRRRFGRTTIMAAARPPRTMPPHGHELFPLLVESNFVYTSTTVRRDVMERTGAFDERLRRAEDWELWLRIAAHGYAAVRSQAPLAVYRVQQGSLSSDTAALHEAGKGVFQLVLAEYPLEPAQHELVAERIASYPIPVEETLPPRWWRDCVARALWIRRYRAFRPRAVGRDIVELLVESQRIS